jgi:drug/metabolite transporter (DMT)-like permease
VFQPVALFGLGSALCAAVAQVGIRGLTGSEPVTRIVFYFALYATAVSALPLPFTWRTPTPEAFLAVMVAGLLATGGQFCLTRAYASAPAQQVGPFIYLTVVFSGLIDWLLWRALPDRLFLAGAVAVVGAAVLTLRLRRTPAAGSA